MLSTTLFTRELLACLLYLSFFFRFKNYIKQLITLFLYIIKSKLLQDFVLIYPISIFYVLNNQPNKVFIK